MMLSLARFLVASVLAVAAQCASVPRAAELQRMRTARSLLDPNVSLSFKEISICETTPGVKSYTGYVNLPANPAEGRPYDIHTFFWFFEARNNPANAPMSIWLQGGPGAASTAAVFGEHGPCFVTGDSKATTLNPWSWNNEVNMLYIDQPVQSGFSYDRLINGTVDETYLQYLVTPADRSGPPPEINSTTLPGVFSSQDPRSTANTTMIAARAAWHFLQTWIQEFPAYKPKNNTFSIWAQSYGGHYGPTFARFFSEQNRRIAGAVPLRLQTVGLVNACVDILEQMPAYPLMAHNNTYGIQLITQQEYNDHMASFPQCRAMVETCRALAAALDPNAWGNVAEVNKACSDAYYFCFGAMYPDVEARGRSVCDITAPDIGHFPPRYSAGYLNAHEEVRLELGVPLNITGLSMAAWRAFMATGDFVLGDNIQALGELLDDGVKVALMYGDRDYQCNWYGGEQVSLAIESTFSKKFRKAGYADIRTNSTYVGGLVRQHGPLSFSRVFEAGHEAPIYQPETAYRIFQRVMFDKDVATGTVTVDSKNWSNYSTTGPESVAGVMNELPPPPLQECYLWAVFLTCTAEQAEMLRNGTAVMQDYIMIGYTLPDGSIHYY